MQVEGQQEGSLLSSLATGARVSNAYPTCPLLGNSPLKGGLMPGALLLPHGFGKKDSSVADGDASD